jgi:hypothetical protein
MPEFDVHTLGHAQKADSKPQRNLAAGHPDRSPDRRVETRHPGPRQVWIQGIDAGGAPIEEVQMMRNYSRSGFYFITNLHGYRVGMRLNVVPSFGGLNLEYVAEVVRVEPRAKMAYGVAVKLLHVREPMAKERLE